MRRWYWCDAAEAFVFLSGLVSGPVYLRVLDSAGFATCQRKGLKRAVQIYLANAVVLVLVVLAAKTLGPVSESDLWRLQYQGIEQSTVTVLSASLLMLFQPMAVDVLTMYIQFMVLLPLVLWLWKRWPEVIVLMCLLLYINVQMTPWFNWPRWPGPVESQLNVRHFNHVTWNVLFVAGAMIGIGMKPRAKVLPAWLIDTLLFTAFAAILCLKNGWIENNWSSTIESSFWGQKRTLGPMRLIAFGVFAYVVSRTVSETACRRAAAFIAPITLLGRHSLLIYSLGLLATHTAWIYLPSPDERTIPMVIGLECGLLMFMLTVAWWADRRKRRSAAPVAGKQPFSEAATFGDA